MPLPIDPAPWTFYRLGPTNEKELFKRRQDSYDGVVIPAHIASYYAAFCAEFIGGLRKPYFIDPMTYIFSQNPIQLQRYKKDKKGKTVRDSFNQKVMGGPKRSYSKLIEQEYGGLILEAFQAKRRVKISDFDNTAPKDDLVEKVISFQRNKLAAVPEKYRKYKKYVKEGVLSEGNNPPMIILPPYFLMDSVGARSWHSVNLDLARKTRESVPDLPVFGVIFCSSETMGSLGKEIVRDYEELELDGFVVWTDGFSGKQSGGRLREVRDFIRLLAKTKKPIISLFGDAYSLVLSYSGLTGFCSGICYGEKKSSDQFADVEGGMPTRYYISLLKTKLELETRRLELSEYPGLLCDCDICLRQPDIALIEDLHAREHFMLSRRQEISAIRSGRSPQDLSEEMASAYLQYKDEPLLGSLGHLANWSRILVE